MRVGIIDCLCDDGVFVYFTIVDIDRARYGILDMCAVHP